MLALCTPILIRFTPKFLSIDNFSSSSVVPFGGEWNAAARQALEIERGGNNSKSINWADQMNDVFRKTTPLYHKPVTIQDVLSLRSIGKKSINVHQHHSNNAANDYIAFDHKLYALGKDQHLSVVSMSSLLDPL